MQARRDMRGQATASQGRASRVSVEACRRARADCALAPHGRPSPAWPSSSASSPQPLKQPINTHREKAEQIVTCFTVRTGAQ